MDTAGQKRVIKRFDIWSFGLFTLIVLFYLSAFLQNWLAWAPFAVVLLSMMAQAPRLNITSRDFYDMRWFLILMGWTFASLFWSVDHEATIDSLRNLVPKLAITFFAYKFPVWQKRKSKSSAFSSSWSFQCSRSILW